MKYNTLSHKDDLYPKELIYMQKPVSSIYVAGLLPGGMTLGVIGSRRPSPYGIWVTQNLVSAASRHGIVIVSGLAIGIDSIAHASAVDCHGPTIAVLPSGIENIYPARHKNLAEKIISGNGALVSEYPGAQSARKDTFIARNRIIAALSDVLLVVEATHKSGTMHTVRFALEQGKEVAAVPGPINSSLSLGSNQLIKDGAHVINSIESLLDLFGVVRGEDSRPSSPHDSLEARILEQLSSGPRHANSLHQMLDIPLSEVSQMMTRLEINNLVAKTADGLYALR